MCPTQLFPGGVLKKIHIQIAYQKALQFLWKGTAGAVGEPLLLFQRRCQCAPAQVPLWATSPWLVSSERPGFPRRDVLFGSDVLWMELVAWLISQEAKKENGAASWTELGIGELCRAFTF